MANHDQEKQRIPSSIGKLLRYPWVDIDYDATLAGHAAKDAETNTTCQYLKYKGGPSSSGLDFAEVAAIIKERAIDPQFVRISNNGTQMGVNQHYEHSLQKFCYEAQQAYVRHLERMEALKGTPSGNIIRGGK